MTDYRDKKNVLWVNGVDQIVTYNAKNINVTPPLLVNLSTKVSKSLFKVCPINKNCIITENYRHIIVNPEEEKL